MSVPDRLKELLDQNMVTGIDFVYVHGNQVTLDVYFLTPPATLSTSLVNNVLEDQIRIYSPSGGEHLPEVSVISVGWVVVDGRDVFQLTTASPGDFTLYKLYIDDSRIDPYFNNITFSFKANCKSDLDCKLPEHKCPLLAVGDPTVDFPVDYQARDFWSFRRALTDFASQRYPDWKDRLEADAGMMMLEVMSALGDELAYYQDRIAREAYLETATQRRSLRRHARLVDYNIHDGLGASTWLDVTVMTGQNGLLPAGTDIWAVADNGARIDYEIGRGLEEIAAGEDYAVYSERNTYEPHIWDEDDVCLFVGTTELFIKGHHARVNPTDVHCLTPGLWVLLKTSPTDASVRERAFMVRLVRVTNTEDPVFNESITHLVWEQEGALPFEMDMAVLEVRGNLVPVTAGKKEEAYFVIGRDPDDLGLPEEATGNLIRAVEREGPNGSVAYLLSLPNLVFSESEPSQSATRHSDSRQLVWLGDQASPSSARPEVQIEEVQYIGATWVTVSGRPWDWKRSLLGSPSSLSYSRDFTLDDGMWKRVVGYQRIGKEIEHSDYASGAGNTIRFGDGEFGLVPAEGTVFKVTYRLGNGRRGNVPAGTLSRVESGFGFIQAVTNPLPSDNGMDPETASEVRQQAPDAFRSITYRAVRPEDYAEAAERLSWVQRAGGVFRWTGSWLSAFVTPDPKDAVIVTELQRSELINQLERFRQAGREAHMLDPRYANLDLEITICVAPDAYRGEVKESVLEALLGDAPRVSASPFFFSPDNFTFGDPLDRSALEAVIQNVPGVRAVKGMKIRRRGWFDWQDFTELLQKVGKNEIIRVENDPLHPERGSLRLIMEGGA